MTQPQFVHADGKNALKVIISGSYKKIGDGEIIEFDNVPIIMPKVEEEYAVAAARKRYAYMAIKSVIDPKTNEPKYPQAIDHIRDVHIDSIKEVEHKFDYYGKGIKQMSEDDLQHLAVEKGLREIPLPRRQSGLSTREMRQATYLAYVSRVLNWDIDMNDPAQNDYAKWNDVIPNPMQKAAPVEQQTIEEQFSKEKPKKKKKAKHVEAEKPVSSAPHVATSEPEVKEEVKPEVVMGSADRLSKLQDLADQHDVEYDWDATEEQLERLLLDAGVKM